MTGVTVRYTAMFDAGISAIDEEQLDLFELLNVEVEKPVTPIAEQELKYPVYCKSPTEPRRKELLDKRLLLLAPNPDKLNSNWDLAGKVDPDVAKLLINEVFESFKSYATIILKRKTVNEKIYKRVITYLLANLLNASNKYSEIVYSRSTSNSNNKLILVVDYFKATKMIHHNTGKANEYQGITSWMWPTKALESKLKLANVRVAYSNGAPVIKMNAKKAKKTRKVDRWTWDGYDSKGKNKFKLVKGFKEPYVAKGKDIEINTGNRAKGQRVKKLSAAAKAYNKMWDNHTITLDGVELVPYCERVFTEDLDLGGRFYNPIQSYSKEQRARILIDGEEVAEPDFKSLHPCMLYAKAKIQLDPYENDPYKLSSKKYSKDTVKRCLLKLWNSDNKEAFEANVTKSGNEDIQKHVERYHVLRAKYEDDLAQGKPAHEPIKSHLHDGFIEGLPIGIKGSELVKEIEKTHKLIEKQLNQSDLGLKLQFEDSQIMSRILLKCVEENILVVPIHDSVICKKSEQERVEEIMLEAYFDEMGFDGFIG